MNRIGTLIKADKVSNISAEFARMKKLGFDVLQISVWDPERYTDGFAAELISASKSSGLAIDALWAGWTGPCEWNLIKGRETIGLVPEEYRYFRVEELKKAADFAQKIKVPYVITHVGFLPDDPSEKIVSAIREVAAYCGKFGLSFLFEAGQETPETLLRTIEAVGLDNVGVNLDTANLILYGKGHPADAVSLLGKYIKCTHIKDGFYPKDTSFLGKETKAGKGEANIPEVIRKLRAADYRGDYIIEREIRDEERLRDVIETRAYLADLVG